MSLSHTRPPRFGRTPALSFTRVRYPGAAAHGMRASADRFEARLHPTAGGGLDGKSRPSATAETIATSGWKLPAASVKDSKTCASVTGSLVQLDFEAVIGL